jgi:hypothetical protein
MSGKTARMNTSGLRVIFDRSAFHGENFKLFELSQLQELTSRCALTVLLTPVFLNETLTAYGSKRPVDWQQHLSYALDVCNGGIFLDKSDIWHEELAMGRGRFARFLLPEKPNRRYDSRPRFVAKLREVANTGDLHPEWVASQEERDEAFLKSARQKKISGELREEAARRLGGRPEKGDLANYPFSAFRATELTRIARHLMSLVDARRALELADQWAQAPQRFPFFTAFVEGFLYNGYYATLEHSERLDPQRAGRLRATGLSNMGRHRGLQRHPILYSGFRHPLEAAWETNATH